jgi:glycerate-2-kinase
MMRQPELPGENNVLSKLQISAIRAREVLDCRGLPTVQVDVVPGIVALFADTDGSDGGTAIAGGLVDSSTAGRAVELGLSLRKGLVDHATTALLEACGDAVLTGATRTNANDLIIIGVS